MEIKFRTHARIYFDGQVTVVNKQGEKFEHIDGLQGKVD